MLALAKSWLCGSPHNEWGEGDIPGAAPGGIATVERYGQTVQIADVTAAGEEWSGLRYQWTEGGVKEWTFEFVCYRADSTPEVGVRLRCDLLDASLRLPRPRRPYIIKLIIEEFRGGVDSWIPVDDLPYYLSEDHVERAARLIMGAGGLRLPVVYMSANDEHRPFVDPDVAAQRLAGVAHVVVEPSRFFSFALARHVEGDNPYRGAVGIFWSTAGGASPRFLPYDYARPTQLLDAVEDRIRQHLAALRPTPELTWTHIVGVVARGEIDRLRREGGAVDNYVEAFDGEKAALEAKLAEANAEVERLRAELRAQEEQSAGILQRGKERDYYPGEIKDAIIVALEAALPSIGEGRRHHHIVEDLLRSNPLSPDYENIPKAIKRVFQDGVLDRREEREIAKFGFVRVRGGGHDRLVYREDARYSFTIPSTPSDHRGGKNMASTINRTLFK